MRPTVGFALCGSFCTFRKAIDALRADGTLKTLSEKYFGQDISSEN